MGRNVIRIDIMGTSDGLHGRVSMSRQILAELMETQGEATFYAQPGVISEGGEILEVTSEDSAGMCGWQMTEIDFQITADDAEPNPLALPFDDARDSLWPRE